MPRVSVKTPTFPAPLSDAGMRRPFDFLTGARSRRAAVLHATFAAARAFDRLCARMVAGAAASQPSPLPKASKNMVQSNVTHGRTEKCRSTLGSLAPLLSPARTLRFPPRRVRS